jgi:hypothetical protein
MGSGMIKNALYSFFIFLLFIFSGCAPVQPGTLDPQLQKDDSKEPDASKPIKPLSEKVSLTVNAPEGARVRLLNIKPKYRDGIVLKRGRYHIEVSKPAHRSYKRWHILNDNTTLEITLKKLDLEANGHIVWQTSKIRFAYQEWRGLAWYRGNGKKMNWHDAKRYCDALSIETNGIPLNDFRLPFKAEVRSYSSRNRIKPSPIWTASDDGNKAITMYGRDAKKAPKSASYPYVRCVTEKVDYNVLSLEQLAKKIYERDYQRRSTLNLPKKPKKAPYPKLTRGEFERSATFKARVAAANAAVDETYATAIAKWKHKVAAKKRKHRQELKRLEKEKQHDYLRAFERAVHIKYGTPRISRVNYNNAKEYFIVGLRSDRGDFDESVRIPVQRMYARKFKTLLTEKNFTPKVEFEVTNGALKVVGIEQIRDPRSMVERNEYKKAYDSVGRLEGFIRKYPDSVYVPSATSRIMQLKTHD